MALFMPSRRNLLPTLLLASLSAVGCAAQPRLAEPPAPPQPAPLVLPAPTIPSACDPASCPAPRPGEGMWPWHDLGSLDEAALRGRGLQVDLSSLWTPGKGGLLRAVAGLRGCSASFVSPDGLLLTNHHCAYGAIQRNATPEHDYLATGFTAGGRSDELPGQGMTVLVFREQSDVTAQVLEGMPERLGDYERLRFIEKRETSLVRTCEKKPNTRCEVARENDGLRFMLLENLELRDVRVVVAPPEALGNYGGEVDNWHWPRHTLDFTLMRAYVAPNGEPADYSKDNVPYRPETHLRLSERTPREGDFIMVAGTPAWTRRYETALSVREALGWTFPSRERLFEDWIRTLEQTAADHPDAKLPTATWLRRLNNGLFHAKGMIAGLRRNRVVERKNREQAAWRVWVAEDPERAERWGTTLDELDAFHRANLEGRDRDLLLGFTVSGAQVLGFARTITKWASERAKLDADRDPGFQDRDRGSLLRDMKHAQRSLHNVADRRVLLMFLERLCALPDAERPAPLGSVGGIPCDPKGLERAVLLAYERTKLGDVEERARAFDLPIATLRASTDPMLRLALQLTPALEAKELRAKQRQGALLRLERTYLQSLIAQRSSSFYPDANGTPRISFAHVAGYAPRDGVWHLPFTTLSGMLDKDTGKEPFLVPPAARRALDGDAAHLTACFLSNADTTGGNSGSPVLDANGSLIGLNFDRVYENIAGDYGYEPLRSRNIMVSTRAILWYLEKVARSDDVVRELRAGSAHDTP